MIEQDFYDIMNRNIDWSKIRNKNFLITGSTGMLGSYIITFLLKLNEKYIYNIKIIAQCRDKNKLLNKINFPESSNYLISTKKIEDEIYYNTKIDYIIHTASPASSQYYKDDFENIFNCNVVGTRNLLNLAKNYNSKFLFLSSGEVCGKIEKETIKEDDYGYLDPLNIRNIYAETKRVGECLCRCYYEKYNVFIYIVRPDHTYSPTMDIINDKRVFAEFVKNIINDENIIIKGDGKATRTFTYITDFVDGIFRVLLMGNSGEVYNISNNKNKVSIKELAEKVIKIVLNKNLKIIFENRNNTNNYIENKNKVQPSLSTKKIEQLGYNPKIDVEEGFKRVIDYLKLKNEK